MGTRYLHYLFIWLVGERKGRRPLLELSIYNGDSLSSLSFYLVSWREEGRRPLLELSIYNGDSLSSLSFYLISWREEGEETTPRTKYLQWGLAIFTIFLSG